MTDQWRGSWGRNGNPNNSDYQRAVERMNWTPKPALNDAALTLPQANYERSQTV